MHESGAEAGGQKIKPCPPHLLSCSGGAGISLSREICVCVCVCVNVCMCMQGCGFPVVCFVPE